MKTRVMIYEFKENNTKYREEWIYILDLVNNYKIYCTWRQNKHECLGKMSGGFPRYRKKIKEIVGRKKNGILKLHYSFEYEMVRKNHARRHQKEAQADGLVRFLSCLSKLVYIIKASSSEKESRLNIPNTFI